VTIFSRITYHASHQGTFTVICPAILIEITPPHIHMSTELLLRAGAPPTITVGEPGDQGAVVTGTQGMGVRTPKAADVAAATAGFVGVVHIPKGMTFTMGILSMILAPGIPPAVTRFLGNTTRLLGATPKLHIIIAPLQTSCAILSPNVLRIPYFHTQYAISFHASRITFHVSRLISYLTPDT
jgi:hypothetical protein